MSDELFETAHFTGGPLDGDSGPIAPEQLVYYFPQMALAHGLPTSVRPVIHRYERIRGTQEFLYVDRTQGV